MAGPPSTALLEANFSHGDYMPAWSVLDVLTLIAIFSGPVLAIMVSRYLENRKEVKERKLNVFRTLMRTRRTPVVPEHVGALNLIEIEFHDNERVLTAWRDLLRHFAATHPRRPDEDITGPMDAHERRSRDERFDRRLAQERQSLLAKLLHAIGKDIGFKAEQLDIFEGGYTPQGWEDYEIENRLIRRFTLDLLAGQRYLPVGVVDQFLSGRATPEDERPELLEQQDPAPKQPPADHPRQNDAAE